jgi:hypothetical protein
MRQPSAYVDVDEAIRTAYVHLCAVLDHMTEHQLAEVASRYRQSANHPTYEAAATAAANIAYETGRVADVGTDGVAEDRVQGVPDEAAPLDLLAGYAAGAGLDLALAVLAYDQLTAEQRVTILALWSGVITVPIPQLAAARPPNQRRPAPVVSGEPRNGLTPALDRPMPTRAVLSFAQRRRRARLLRLIATLCMLASPPALWSAAATLATVRYEVALAMMLAAVALVIVGMVLFARARGLIRTRR